MNSTYVWIKFTNFDNAYLRIWWSDLLDLHMYVSDHWPNKWTYVTQPLGLYKNIFIL